MLQETIEKEQAAPPFIPPPSKGGRDMFQETIEKEQAAPPFIPPPARGGRDMFQESICRGNECHNICVFIDFT